MNDVLFAKIQAALARLMDEADYETALARIDALMDAERNTPEGDELDVLTDLVEHYEENRREPHAPLNDLPLDVHSKHYTFYECDLKDIRPPRLERNYEEWGGTVYPGIARWSGPCKIHFKRALSEIDDFVRLWSATEKAAFRLVFNDGTTFTFDAFVWEVMTGPEPSISLHMTGPVEVQHPNCRCIPAPVNAKEKTVFKKTKVLNRFYVASDKMISEAEQSTPNMGEQTVRVEYYYERGCSRPRHTRWAKHDLKQAIEHAREILDNDPSKNEVAIVRIVKMVRRKATPVIVEDVR